MLRAGYTQTLAVSRISDYGLFLADEEGNEVLLPNRYVSLENRVGDRIEVFVYHDSENRLGAIAEALKKLVTWILTTALLVFTIYLSIVRIISGSADSATVKVAKAAISGVVP